MIQTINPGLSTALNSMTKHKGLFGTLDDNDDGKIDKKEFSAFAKKAGIEDENIFKEIDTDGDGNISEAEFKMGLQKIKDALFSSVDSKNKGYLTIGDVKKLAEKLGIDSNKLLAKLDLNKEGKISKTEFDKKVGRVLNHLSRLQKSATPATSPESQDQELEEQSFGHIDVFG
jgi:Ca2+-binding EF-hand superfamily protein